MSNQSLFKSVNLLRRADATLARQFAPYARQFGTTVSRGVGATFTKTDNEELNSHLKLIQERLIYPAYLPLEQRKILHSPSNREKLERNPIVLEIDGTEHKFSYIDPNSDIPCSSKSMGRALNLMKSAEDWENLATLFAGYKKANLRIHRQHKGKAIRCAYKTGNLMAIVECAKQVERTGYTLNTHEIVLRLMASICSNIIDHKKPGVEQKASKRMDIVLDLLLQPGHKRDQDPEDDLHMTRLARGLVLFSRASAAAAKQAAGEEATAELNQVRDEVALLKALWEGIDLSELGRLPEFIICSPVRMSGHGQLNGFHLVEVMALNMKALSLARDLNPAESSELQPVEPALSEYLTEYVTSDYRRRGGWAMRYKFILGSLPPWSELQGMDKI